MFAKFAQQLAPFYKEQLLSNILREWCKVANVICPTKIFYIDSHFHGNNSTEQNMRTICRNDIETAIKYYSTGISDWVGNQTSFGIIHRYLVKRDTTEKGPTLFSSNQFYHGISMILFCPKSETFHLQQTLTRLRRQWYRKLSKAPLNSGFKSILNENENTLNIVYKPKQINCGSDLTLDTIILNGAEENSTKLEKQFDILLTQTNLDTCTMAFLDDAFTVGDNDKIVLKLHPALTPFQLAITFEAAINNESLPQLTEVANYLITSLMEHSDISIYPFVHQNMISRDDSDKLAIQYCVILKEETLKNGVIWLYNRDTQISEMIHISNFLKTLLYYLQPARLITLEECKQSSADSIPSKKTL